LTTIHVEIDDSPGFCLTCSILLLTIILILVDNNAFNYWRRLWLIFFIDCGDWIGKQNFALKQGCLTVPVHFQKSFFDQDFRPKPKKAVEKKPGGGLE
jgi:hypothetical protein